MALTLSGNGTITGLVAGGLPDATITGSDLASGAAASNLAGGTIPGALVLGRNDSISEGGELRFNRSSDNAAGWVFDVLGSGSTPILRIFNSANKGIQIDANGIIDLGAAGSGGIRFPVSQIASSNANTLDDYEEGTGSFSLIQKNAEGAGINTGINSYRYTKIGNFVFLAFRVLTLEQDAFNWQFSGLPFSSAFTDLAVGVAFSGKGYPATVNMVSATQIRVNVSTEAGSPSPWPYIYGTITYNI